MQAMVWWTNASDGTHNCDGNATCYDTPTSFICHCNANYNGTGEQGQCHREYHYHYNLLNVSL